ncbi:hypothetical protein [Streptomyces sp. NPDC002550]
MLTEAKVTHPTIHCRIHDVDTGELLGFGSPGGSGALGAAVQHFQEVQQENPGRRLSIRTYDEPAYFTEQ